MNEKQIFDPRRAGLVSRYHAQIHLSNQSVGEHTWQVLRILTTVWPQVPAHIMTYVVYHDVAEGVVGDVPYPTKLADLRIKHLMDKAEDQAVDDMALHWGTPPIPKLNVEQKAIVKACELVEMWEYSLHEQNLGNKYAVLVANRLLPRIKDTQFGDTELSKRFHAYVKRRGEYENEYR